jgi:hypothetical protein
LANPRNVLVAARFIRARNAIPWRRDRKSLRRPRPPDPSRKIPNDGEIHYEREKLEHVKVHDHLVDFERDEYTSRDDTQVLCPTLFHPKSEPLDEVHSTQEAGEKGDLFQGLDVDGRYLVHNEAHDRVMRIGMESQDPNVNHRHEVLVDQPHQFEGHDDQEQTEQ